VVTFDTAKHFITWIKRLFV